MVGEVVSVFQTRIDEANKAGDLDRVVEMAGLGATVAEHLRLADSTLPLDDLINMGMLQEMLKALPPDTEYGDSGKTVEDRISEMVMERAGLKGILNDGNALDAFMENLTDAQVSEFTDKVILHGERAARNWLAELMAAQTPAENEPACHSVSPFTYSRSSASSSLKPLLRIGKRHQVFGSRFSSSTWKPGA